MTVNFRIFRNIFVRNSFLLLSTANHYVLEYTNEMFHNLIPTHITTCSSVPAELSYSIYSGLSECSDWAS